MMPQPENTLNLLRRWRSDQSGVALMEAAVVFPILFLMLFGVFDIGNAITTNHKLINSANVIADLLTRAPTVDDTGLNEAVKAGQLSLMPYVVDEASMVVDIVSVEFDENLDPQVVWRETIGKAIPDQRDNDAVDNARGLGGDGEGVVIVTVVYDYVPTFGSVIIDAFRMRETAYARGRRSSIVTRI